MFYDEGCIQVICQSGIHAICPFKYKCEYWPHHITILQHFCAIHSRFKSSGLISCIKEHKYKHIHTTTPQSYKVQLLAHLTVLV